MGAFKSIEIFADEVIENIEKDLEKESDFYKMAAYKDIIMKLSFKNKLLENKARMEREEKEMIEDDEEE